MWVAGHSSVRVGLKIGAEGVRLVAKHPGCSVVERWDIYIYIYIYMCVCVCVCCGVAFVYLGKKPRIVTRFQGVVKVPGVLVFEVPEVSSQIAVLS